MRRVQVVGGGRDGREPPRWRVWSTFLLLIRVGVSIRAEEAHGVQHDRVRKISDETGSGKSRCA